MGQQKQPKGPGLKAARAELPLGTATACPQPCPASQHVWIQAPVQWSLREHSSPPALHGSTKCTNTHFSLLFRSNQLSQELHPLPVHQQLQQPKLQSLREPQKSDLYSKPLCYRPVPPQGEALQGLLRWHPQTQNSRKKPRGFISNVSLSAFQNDYNRNK